MRKSDRFWQFTRTYLLDKGNMWTQRILGEVDKVSLLRHLGSSYIARGENQIASKSHNNMHGGKLLLQDHHEGPMCDKS